MAASTTTGEDSRKKCIYMIIKWHLLRIWLNFTLNHTWPNLQVNDYFTKIGSNVAMQLANLPLSIRVQTTLLASTCHAMSLQAVKHGWLGRFDIVVKNKLIAVKRGLHSYRQRYSSSQSKFVAKSTDHANVKSLVDLFANYNLQWNVMTSNKSGNM